MSEYILRNEVLQRLHEAGGCDATDEWARGYDAGITEAIDIIDNIPSANVALIMADLPQIEQKTDESKVNDNGLKPCPFCGSIAEMCSRLVLFYCEGWAFQAKCTCCGASIPELWSREEEVKAWNRRAESEDNNNV